ncbi:hypothetical protein PHK61_11555 [Actinomycetospora lutea]|uniref:DUF6541 family protein n=1 Tax=Actinomycetospora lutea TaxID=663604 RepID=UPI0023650907|nr:DUF6541 family protein [Actinomycetospora lutea]MDD7939051.1 hypothetical protein [Actinomycetospora lutea]
MLLDVAGFVVGVCLALVPGTCAMLLIGVRGPWWYLALSAPCSVAVASLTGLITTAVGASFGFVALAVVSVVLAGAAVVRRALLRRGRAAPGKVSRATSVRTVPMLAGTAAIGAGLGVSVLTWLGGMGWSLRTYPQEHDMIYHLAVSSYVARTGVGAPWALAPTDVLSGSDTIFYPAGFHLLAGAVAQVTGDVVVSVNALALVLVGLGMPLAAACLAWALARANGCAPDTAVGAAGVACVLMATLYRPGVQLAHDGGVLPNSVALALCAGVLAALVSWRRAPRAVLVSAGLATAGAVIAHPSAVVTLGLTMGIYLIVDVARRGRRDLRRVVRALAAPAALALLVALPTLIIGARAVAATTSFDSETPDRPVAQAVGKALTFAYGGYLDPDSTRAQVGAAVLIVGGLLVLVATRRCLPLLAAVAGWFAIVVSYFVAPGRGAPGVITSFFYNSEPRVWSQLSLVAVPAGALGVAIAARWAARRLPHVGRPVVPWVTAGLLLLVVAAYLVGPGYGYARVNENAVASRFATPDFTRVNGDDEAAAAWLAGHVQSGQRVLNSANDGSTILYTEHGLPVVNLASLGSAAAPYTYRLLAGFRTYPTDPVIRRDLLDLRVAWLYVDSEAPPIGVGGAPSGWPGVDRLTVPRGFEDLTGLPGLTPAFRAGTVTVYRLDPVVVAGL